jgi:hypothetical protein
LRAIESNTANRAIDPPAIAYEVIFTSSATESDNAAIHAMLMANPSKRHVGSGTFVGGKLYLVVGRDGWPRRPQFGIDSGALGEHAIPCYVPVR